MTLFYDRSQNRRQHRQRQQLRSDGHLQDQQTVWCTHCGGKGLQVAMEFCGTSYFKQIGRQVEHFRCPVDARHHRGFVNNRGRREELFINR